MSVDDPRAQEVPVGKKTAKPEADSGKTGHTSRFVLAGEELPPARLGLDFVYDLQWVLFYRNDRGGEAFAVSAIIDGEGALRRLDVGRVNRSRYRELLKEMAPRERPTREVSGDEAFARVLAAESTREGRALPPVEGAAFLATLTAPSETRPVETTTSDEGAASPIDREAFARAASERTELRGWIPEEGALKAFAEAVRSAQASLVAIDSSQVAAQIDSAVKAAAAAYFTRARCTTHGARLDDIASLYDARTGNGDAAALFRAIGRELRAERFDATAHPFSLWFFGRFVPALVEQRDVERTREPREPATSKGGIVLP